VLGRVVRRLPVPAAMAPVHDEIDAAVSHDQDRHTAVPMLAVRAKRQVYKGLLLLVSARTFVFSADRTGGSSDMSGVLPAFLRSPRCFRNRRLSVCSGVWPGLLCS
jgi:hypothetical protein